VSLFDGLRTGEGTAEKARLDKLSEANFSLELSSCGTSWQASRNGEGERARANQSVYLCINFLQWK